VACLTELQSGEGCASADVAAHLSGYRAGHEGIVIEKPQESVVPESTPWDARTPTARSARAAGALLIGGSILEIAAMAHHPSVHAHDMAAVLVQLQALSAASAWVHGVLIALMLTVFFALIEFAWQRGITRPAIRAGLIAYAAGVVAMMGAALVDGFVTPRVAMLSTGVNATDLQVTAQLLKLCMLFNQALARLGAVAMSVGITAWSADLVRGAGAERALGVFGVAIGLGSAGALILGALQLDVHGMMLVLLLQVIWTTGVGVLLLRTRHVAPPHHPMP
jgi:hypothetical protein